MENSGVVGEGRPEDRAGENGGVAEAGQSAVKRVAAEEEGSVDVVVEDGDDAVAAEEVDGDEVGEENQGAGGHAVESGTPVAGDHQPVVTPNTRVVLETGRHAAEKWGEDSPRAEINVEGSVEENAMGQTTKGYCHTKRERPESITRSAAEPAIIIEELDDLGSSDDENTATSAPPAQSLLLVVTIVHLCRLVLLALDHHLPCRSLLLVMFNRPVPMDQFLRIGEASRLLSLLRMMETRMMKFMRSFR